MPFPPAHPSPKSSKSTPKYSALITFNSCSLLLKLLLSSPSLHYALCVFSNLPLQLLPKIFTPFLLYLSRSTNPEIIFFGYQRLRADGVGIDRFSFPPVLNVATKLSALSEGRELHVLIFKLGFDSDTFIQTGLVGMYSSCGRISEARLLFDNMSHRDIALSERAF